MRAAAAVRYAAGTRGRPALAGVLLLPAFFAGAVGAQPAADVPVFLTDVLAPLGEEFVLRAPPVRAGSAGSARSAATAPARRVPGGPTPPNRFAEPFGVAAGPGSHGRWETVGGGRTAVWRLRVAAEGAVSLNLGFSRYRMPPGGRLFLYTPDGVEVIGPFTDADNKAHGELWTPLLPGGELVVEASVPAGRAGELELELASVNRGFRDLADVVSASHDACQVDVACPDADNYRDQVRSVGLMTTGGTGGCTGALVNNTAHDGTPYFLTAGHCGFEEDPERTARSVVVYWNYERATCGGTDEPGRDQFQSGARFLAGSRLIDVVLLELDDRPGPAHNVYYAGWDLSGAGVDSAVLINHPKRHVKSIVTVNSVDAVTDTFGFLDADGPMWRTTASAGGAEFGSSGSPLFDPDGRVIGVHVGGHGVLCVNDVDYAGRLAKLLTAEEVPQPFGKWLDPRGSGATAVGGRNWNGAPEAVGGLDDQALKFVQGETPAPLTVDVAYGFRDPDGDALTFGVSSSDDAVVSVSVSGSMLTLTPAAAGTVTVTVDATDAGGLNETASQEMEVSVGGNSSPEAVGGIEGLAWRVGDGDRSVDVASKIRDADGDVLTYGASSSDTSVARVSLSGTTVTVTPVAGGAAVVTVTATDASGSGTSARQRFEAAVNRGPAKIRPIPPLSLRLERGAATVDASVSMAGTSDVLVDYATSDGTASAGSDYTATSGTLTFSQGSTSPETVRVPLLNDGDDESEEETFTLTLSNARNGVLVDGWSQAAGTIEDDDDPRVTVSFARSSYAVTEGSSARIQVRLDKDPERTVTVPLVETPLGGAGAEDYFGVPLEVTFEPGELSAGFRFLARDDDEDEDGETVELSFGSFLPDRVTAGGSTVLAINDNDGGGTPPGGPGGPGVPPPPPPDDDDDGGFTPPRAAIRTDAVCADGLCRALTAVPVRFEDDSTGSVQRRSWDFGEGSSRSATVNWSWSEPGFHEVTLRVSGGEHESTASLVFLVEASELAGTCVAGAETLCLQDSRFSVAVEWWTVSGERGAGEVVRRGSNDSGLFSFFGGGNWEMLVKVLDGCPLNGHVWVFGASATDLGYRITVTDTASGKAREYMNEAGLQADAIADVFAFAGSCGGRQ